MSSLSVRTLTFGKGGNARPHLREGWSHEEGGFVWTVGRQSRLVMDQPVGTAGYSLRLKVTPCVVDSRVPSQLLTVEVNGTTVASQVLTEPTELECSIPQDVAVAAEHLDIVFKHPDCVAPACFTDSLDDRPLAFAFEECSVSAEAPEIPPADSDYLVPPPELLFDGATNAVEFRETGEGFTRVNLIQRARLQPNERVLDLGSGNGQKARVLAYYLDRNGSYVGLDIVRAGVEWCRQRYAIFPNFRFEMAEVYSSHYNPEGRCLDAEYRLPFPDGEFDLVFLSSVFTHMLPDGVANYIAEISRVLKRGGRCVSTFFLLNRDSVSRIQAGASSLNFAHEFDLYRVIDRTNPSKAVALGEDWVRERLVEAGLRVAEATYGTWCGAPDLLAAYQDVLISVKE